MHIKLSKNVKITLSILFIFIGIFLLNYNYFSNIKKNVFNNENIKLMEQLVELSEEVEELVNDEENFTNQEIISNNSNTNEDVNNQNNNNNKNVVKFDYIGYLSIPDINLKRGFVDPNSKYNSVSYNIMIIPTSTMPDVENGNFILAAHRGNSSVSFFDKLYKLKIGSYAIINYNGKDYKYKLLKTYEEEKDGMLSIKRNSDKTTLTLITCTRNNKKTQTVFIYELESIE